MADLFDLASRLTCGCSVSGFEHGQEEALRYIRDKYFDEMRREPAGSYVFVRHAKKPGYPRIMFDAHMDEVGMLITKIRDDGELEYQPAGVDCRVMPGRRLAVGKPTPRPDERKRSSMRPKSQMRRSRETSEVNLPLFWCHEKWLVRFAVDCEKPLERLTCRSRSLVTRASSNTALDTLR